MLVLIYTLACTFHDLCIMLIMHHCIRVETEPVVQVEVEPSPEPVSDAPTVEQGRHLSIYSILFWINLCLVICAFHMY